MTPMRFAGIVCLLWLAAASSATAGEEETPFSTLYTTDLLPQGEAELEQSAVWGNGKPGESFNAVEGRTEVEYGWSENFQLSGSALYDWAIVRAHTSEAPDPDQDGLEFKGVSAEAIYRLLNSRDDDFGLALYLEPTIGPGYREIEAKVLLQKNLLDDRLVLAANAVWENEWFRALPDLTPGASSSWNKETELRLAAGAAYRFAPEWTGGLEFTGQHDFDGFLWQRNTSAVTSYYVGPALHYERDGYWLTLGAQVQLPWAANLSGEPEETVNGFAGEEARYRLRLKFGFDL
jgi:hypothetical protein